MKKRPSSSFFILLALSVFDSAAAAEVDYIARAVSVSGKVLARGEGGGTVQMTFLKPGDPLFKGAIVNTGSNGAVKLLMTDRTIIDIGPSSLFKLNDYQLNKEAPGDRKVDLSLDYGRVRASVNEKITTNRGKFTIRTKTATMGVRGTEFVVSAPIPESDAGAAAPPTMSVTVIHGKVEVADAKGGGSAPVAVTPGFQFAKAGQGSGQVGQIGATETAKIKSEAFQKDMTFLQSVSFDSATSKADNENKAGAGGKNESAKSEVSKNGGSQTIENLGTMIETQSKDAPRPTVGDLQLPGVFTPGLPPFRPIDQLNGRFVNLRVRICPNANGC